MNKINKILACVDFSEYSLMTLRYAVELTKETDRQIIVFHVVNQRDYEGIQKISDYLPYVSTENETAGRQARDGKQVDYLPYRVIEEDYITALKKERLERMENLIKEYFNDEKSNMCIKIDTGIPFDCILKAIETEGVDLVVMANKGRGNIARVLFGSAAEKVFRHSPVPVLSVRDKMNFKRS